MDAEALARLERATRDALIHIAYGPALRFKWAEAFKFALRDIVREWRRHSPSSYGAPYVRELRMQMKMGVSYSLPTFGAIGLMLWYLVPVAFIADCLVRAAKIWRQARTFHAGVRRTRRSARSQLALDAEAA